MTTPGRTGSLADEAGAAFRDYLAGDTARMADLVRLLTPPLWAAVRSCGLTREQAEDVVQGAWVSLVRHADGVRDPQAVFAWLLTSVRRESWRVAGGRPTQPLDVEPVDETSGPEDSVLDADANARLWRHVATLNPRCQALLRVVAYAATPDYAAISKALGMPVGSIGPTRGRCLAALRAALSRDPGWSRS
ncbi:RNA polymerase sigma factor [Tessaracoccus lacteus]|uniref:Sigma-70 family RNA polymerase sigma factor n=1 Tax=Tessaracoccus lacteus TaxID=3041766 RepID=A0ABY8PWN3_9ACTN|nr:sigma-70 family RNA polymerase sigma factor [Tessaracoccus sp. T21]WGT46903.1 sigma-70 family RNA polymerase sigma factor [Tessaracoccus sp. T21]